MASPPTLEAVRSQYALVTTGRNSGQPPGPFHYPHGRDRDDHDGEFTFVAHGPAIAPPNRATSGWGLGPKAGETNTLRQREAS
jgi:hypothetical protein